MTALEIAAEDLEQLREAGLSAAEVERQVALLRDPPAPIDLDRPCLIGDGIESLSEVRRGELGIRFGEAASAGRFSLFVPASGAATRMFRSLVSAREGQDEDRDLVRRKLLPRLSELALEDELAAFLGVSGERLGELGLDPVLDALVGPDGLALADLPKGLVPFHRTPEGPRTPFEEHLGEAAEYLVDDQGDCSLHFTIPESHRSGFEALLDVYRKRLPGVELEVSFTHQERHTDTVALAEDGRLFHDDDGRLLLRPGGHGALLENLQKTGGDIVIVKNIDNIQPARQRPLCVAWKAVLGGRLLELEERVVEVLEKMDHGLDAEARKLSREVCAEIHRPLPEELASDDRFRLEVRRRLERPLRVCGMVRNEGEPGGGPFWVRGEEGSSLQIVEGAQVDLADREQAEIWARSTHFNPVDLVLGLRNYKGEPWPLADFRDDGAVFVSRKSRQGRPLSALEHPGLWNGSMAHWNTVFVEVPAATFAPVKTIFDLLRPAHLP